MSNKCVYLFIRSYLFYSPSVCVCVCVFIWIIKMLHAWTFKCGHDDITHKNKLRLNSLISFLGLNLFPIDAHFLPHRSKWPFYSNEMYMRFISVFLSCLPRCRSISLTLTLFVCTTSACVLFYDQLIRLIVLQTKKELNGSYPIRSNRYRCIPATYYIILKSI